MEYDQQLTSLQVTYRLRADLQSELQNLQRAIDQASKTLARTRNAIVQLSLFEDGIYSETIDTRPNDPEPSPTSISNVGEGRAALNGPGRFG